MSTLTSPTEPRGFFGKLYVRVVTSSWFLIIYAIVLILGTLFTLLTGLVGLVACAVTAVMTVFVNVIDPTGVGWLFVVTTASLVVFNVTFGPIVLDGGGSEEEQGAMRLTLVLSIICMVVTGAGAYLILTGNPWALVAAILVPLINLVFFAVSLIRDFLV